MLWSRDSPFHAMAKELQPNQRVNHFPRSPFTQKDWLASQPFEFVPRSFLMPTQQDEFAEAYSEDETALWVRKNSEHRGVRITSPLDASLHGQDADAAFFIQAFVHPPSLIFDHKWDLGLYVLLVSLDPLVFYIHREVVLRFCPVPYPELPGPNNIDGYVVADNFLPPWDFPALDTLRQSGDSSNAILGKAYGEGWAGELRPQCHAAVASLLQAVAGAMLVPCKAYPLGQQHFFELYRFDFVFDAGGKAWLMEANYSPNLSPAAHAPLRPLFTQVIDDVLDVVGPESRGVASERPDSVLCGRWITGDSVLKPSFTTVENVPTRAAKGAERWDEGGASFTVRGCVLGKDVFVALPDRSTAAALEQRTGVPWEPVGGEGEVVESAESVESFEHMLDEKLRYFYRGALQQRCPGRDEAFDVLAEGIEYRQAQLLRDVLVLRAAAVQLKGKTILLPGPRGSGKSTLVLAFLAAGAALVSERYVLVNSSGEVIPCITPILVRPTGWAAQSINATELGIPLVTRVSQAHEVIIVTYTPQRKTDAPQELAHAEALEHMEQLALNRSEAPALRGSLKLLLSGAVVRRGTRGEAAEWVAALAGY